MFITRIADKAAASRTQAGRGAPPGNRRRLLFVALYILGLLLFVEGAARLTWRFIDTSWGMVVPQDISRFDETYGWSLAPGTRSVSKATGRPVEYAINAKGLRGPEIPYDKPAGTYRIVLLGDSHTFGFGVPADAHFAALLEGYLPGTQVVNMGVSGYGIDQELLLLEREGFRYRPDLVMVYVPHYADLRHLRDKVWGMGKPRYVRRDGGLVLANCPVANNDRLRMWGLDADRFLSGVSRAYLLARDTVFHFAVSREQLVGKEPPPRAVLDEAEAMGEALIDAMARASAAHGAKFLLVTRVGELAVHAYKAGIPCLYVADPLANPLLSLAGDPTRHPNEAASGVLAWTIAHHLRSQALLPGADHPFPTSP